jgi:hypothetical protein
LNRKQALALARKLWGSKATATVRRDARRGNAIGDYYGKYNINSGTFACNDGKGKVQVWANSFHSWEDAFERAKRCYKYWTLLQRR